MSQSVSLNEFIEQGYELEKLKPYEDFLIECSQKDYGELITQKHHILPRWQKGSDKKENLIQLSLKDHYDAHLKLAFCFPEKSPERTKNISGANRVVQKARHHYKLIHGESADESTSEYWEDLNLIMKELMKGENNYNFGRKFSKETCERIRQSQIGLHLGEKNGMFGRKHSSESIEKMKEKLKGKFIGHKSHRFGKKFGPISDAHKEAISKANKGILKSKETREKMSKAQMKPIRLESNVFYCILDLTETQKFYRICSCGKILYYKTYQYANGAEINKSKCKSCNKKGKSSPIKGKIVGPRKYKVKQPKQRYDGENNPNFGRRRSEEWKRNHSKLIIEKSLRNEDSPSAKKVIDNRTGIEYGCVNLALQQLNLSRRSYEKLVKDGTLQVYKSEGK